MEWEYQKEIIKEKKMKENGNKRRMRKKRMIMKRKEDFSLVPLGLNGLKFD
jgi:hypothetical protein